MAEGHGGFDDYLIREKALATVSVLFVSDSKSDCFKVIGVRPLAPDQNSVSLKLIQRKTLNFVINLPDVENITK